MLKQWNPKQIRELRELYRETQAEFCLRLGVSCVTFRFWENGRYPPMGPARLLLDRLEGDLDVLPGRTARPSRPLVGAASGACTDGEQLREGLASLPDKSRDNHGKDKAAPARNRRNRKCAKK